jgi:nickel/cobalt transporter (NicO) family protein
MLKSLLIGLVPVLVLAHPMGNFSVSHYAKFQVGSQELRVLYALDLAEIPSFELLRQWNLDVTSPQLILQTRAVEQARVWIDHLTFKTNGQLVHPRLDRTDLVIADGAGNLPIIRITMRLHLETPAGLKNEELIYSDENFAGRAGWKEIVITNSGGATLISASQTNQDISKDLTEYPQDPTIAPPQDLRAEMRWQAAQPALAHSGPLQRPASPAISSNGGSAPAIVPIPQPNSRAAAAPALRTAAGAPRGSIVRGDFLSKLLHQRAISFWMIVVALAVAFALGGAHALTPGHGKTIVAAYLVGSRGTLKHAAFLGAMVTFTHTVAVFLLGLIALFFFNYLVPENITRTLGTISGLSIVAIGCWMLYKRFRILQAAADGHTLAYAHAHSHGHYHEHEHTHSHSDHGHEHVHDHPHGHGHDHHHHHHGPGGHTHVPDEISWAGLVALGASGGLVPCESALVLLLSAVALGRVGLGLLLLLAFSLGLASVLMGIGILVLYAKRFLPRRQGARQTVFFRWVPIASAAIVVIIGAVMSGISLGWIQPHWAVG